NPLRRHVVSAPRTVLVDPFTASPTSHEAHLEACPTARLTIGIDQTDGDPGRARGRRIGTLALITEEVRKRYRRFQEAGSRERNLAIERHATFAEASADEIRVVRIVPVGHRLSEDGQDTQSHGFVDRECGDSTNRRFARQSTHPLGTWAAAPGEQVVFSVFSELYHFNGIGAPRSG